MAGQVSIAVGNDRVRRYTSPEAQAKIDSRMHQTILGCSEEGQETIAQRIAKVEREWTVDRALMAAGAGSVLLGLLLGKAWHRAWLALPALAGAVLIQHATQGWCPPLPFFRRLGFRTAKEIALEKHALKALRGDYRTVPEADDDTGIRVWKAIAAAL